MHPNPIFRVNDRAQALDFAQARGFGALIVNDADGPLIAHVPFVLNEGGARMEAHLARSNPILRALRDGPLRAVMAVSGADAYVSPDWYGVEDQVPTWNYVAVHLRGVLSLAPPESLRGHLDRLSAAFERRLPGKAPWSADKMTEAARARMERMILPVSMTVETAVGTRKLSQNKTPEARAGVVSALAAQGGAAAEIAALMRDIPPESS